METENEIFEKFQNSMVIKISHSIVIFFQVHLRNSQKE